MHTRIYFHIVACVCVQPAIFHLLALSFVDIFMPVAACGMPHVHTAYACASLATLNTDTARLCG